MNLAGIRSIGLLTLALVATASCDVVSGLDAFEAKAASGGSSVGGAAIGGNASTGGSASGGGEPAKLCGNGTLNASEECDDSNTISGDGCSQQCHLEEDPDGCQNSGAHIQLTTAGIWIRDDTTGRGASESTTCGGASASELLFEVELMQAGLVTATIKTDYTGVVAMAGWCWPNDAFNCDSNFGESSVARTFDAGATVYVFVGGVSGEEGAFTLQLTLQP